MLGFVQKEITSLEPQGNFVDCVIRDARKALNGRNRVSATPLARNTSFLKLKGGQFALLYTTTKQRDEVSKLLKENFKEKGSYFSEPLPDGSQVPRVIWPFEYEGHIGLLVECLNAYDASMDNPEKWLYQGIVLDPVAYFGKSKAVKSKIRDRAEWIMRRRKKHHSSSGFTISPVGV